MTDSVPKNGTAARQLWVSIAGLSIAVFGTLAGGIWWLGGISTDVRSSKDQIAIHASQIAEIKARQQTFEVELAQLKSQQIETETQFCASDIVRNLMHANELREIAMLHNAVFHTTYPTDNAYYPTICRRDIGAK